MNPGARVCLGRRTLPDLKDTIYKKVLDHISEDLTEGVDFFPVDTRGYIRFSNGSEVISRSWADRKSKKARSLDLSMLCVEEASENDDKDKEAVNELRMRVGRIPSVNENIVIMATNPDSPSHWIYKYFFLEKKPTRHVYYSITTDNPFLKPQYIEQLKRDLDPILARRMLYGEWLDIKEDVIYHQYQLDTHFRDQKFKPIVSEPIHFSFDFNIGQGKPMSCVFFQYFKDTFHFFDEAIVEGADTRQLLEEMAERELFNEKTQFVCHGDATGKSRSSKSLKSDYDIIKEFFDKYRTPDGRKVMLKYDVPIQNPPVRTRHNIVNTYMRNSKGDVRLYVYEDCKILHEGLRLTKLKTGGTYTEDDSKYYQHCTTALGYGIVSCVKKQKGTFQELDRWKIWEF